MAEPETSPAPRRRGIFVLARLLVAVAVLGGVAALAIGAFQLGLAAGLATAGGVLVVYSVPATLFDWPRLSLADIADLFSWIWEAICGFFSALFDWS